MFGDFNALWYLLPEDEEGFCEQIRVRFSIPHSEDRANMVSILAAAGYAVRIVKEQTSNGLIECKFYVEVLTQKLEEGTH